MAFSRCIRADLVRVAVSMFVSEQMAIIWWVVDSKVVL